ncbi:MAG: hypothetical protein JSS42_03965 [Proteobacteria bacterium]|uniref:hypothetical protein n=1 Tax=Rudaea sp. TaxID=2136325 RepID=UPI0032203A4F|nr:hypothetical protein [Pseudomonadota bacterium]
MLLLVVPATARAGVRANLRAANGPKGERLDGASKAGIQPLWLLFAMIKGKSFHSPAASGLLFFSSEEK